MSEGTEGLATLCAVRRAMHAELGGTEPGAESSGADVTRILDTANVLFHRALLEDQRAVRRDVSRRRLRALLDEVPGARGSAGDEYAAVGAHAAAIAGDDPVGARMVRILAATDLPELGVDAPADVLDREAAAMNSLGESQTSDITAETLAGYLADRFDEEIRVREVRGLSGGFSKTTTLATVERPGGVPEEIVLRQITPGRDGHTLVGEFEAIRFVHAGGADVPEPLWIDPADNALGGPFFASRRAAGANVGDVFGPFDGTVESAATELATALGRLHAIDVSERPVTPIPQMVDRADIAAAIDEQEQLVASVVETSGHDPGPLPSLLFAWLRNNLPDGVQRPVLLHGDPGFHNVLLDDGRLTAMLDWERARIGDAAQDLAYVRPHVTKVQSWERFLQAYREAGGTVPSEDVLRFYAVWHDTWRFTGAYRGLGRLRTAPRTLLDGVLGLLHAPRFLFSGLENAYEVEL